MPECHYQLRIRTGDSKPTAPICSGTIRRGRRQPGARQCGAGDSGRRRRLLPRRINRIGHEGPADLGKVETLLTRLLQPGLQRAESG
jgi:hypothetical protein